MDTAPRKNLPTRQQGLALLAIVFVLGLAATAYTLHALNTDKMKIEHEKITTQALSEGRSALISWAVSNPSQPGMLPYPDRNGDGNYDGDSDCSTVAFNYSFLMGRLPWRAADNANCATLISGMGNDIKDGSGESLWYVVSRNLVYDYPNAQYPVINPGMINSPNTATAPYQRLGGTTAYPWLTVYDKKGQLLSNRVAVILIAPGTTIGDQNRAAAAPNASEYLDTFTLAAGGGAKSNRTYSMPDEDFYMGEDMSKVLDGDTVYSHPYYFNDKLIYITIDELMAEIQKRAMAEARSVLNDFYTNSGYYPRPALLGSIKNYYADNTQLRGMLPINNTAQAACTCSGGATRTCTCGFDKVSSIEFTRSGAQAWTGNTNSCNRSGNKCTCTGAGTCTRNAQVFSCTAAGVCTSGTNGTYKFNGSFNTHTLACPTSTTFTCNSVSCGITTANIAAANRSFSNVYGDPNNFNDGTVQLKVLPGWFVTNQWQDYIYYEVSSNCVSGQPCDQPTLTVGSENQVRALLVGAGNPIIASPFSSKGSAQLRPTTACNVNDYLDSAENISANNIYDKTSMPRGDSYNDQMMIVAP